MKSNYTEDKIKWRNFELFIWNSLFYNIVRDIEGIWRMNFKKGIRKPRPLELCLLIIFAVQLLMVLYFNIALLGEHMGYDSSWSYLKASLIWKENSLISGAWNDQTNVFLDSSMPLASLLYGITGN